MSENFVEKCVASAVKKIDFISYEIKQKKENNKGEGYAGDVIFVTVEGVTKNGQESLDLALKTSKDSEELRKQAPLRKVFLKEIYIYEDVKATFEKFQREKGLDYQIKFMPHCYATVVDSNREALVFENLKTRGFELWDQTKPMTIKHVSLVLEAYGQWHALSMALKTQQPDVFGKLVENNTNMFTYVLHEIKFDVAVINEYLTVQNLLRADNATDLDFSADNMEYSFNEMYSQEPKYHVILHGDCWNNNILFKPPNDPLQVQILDWQCSGLAAPVFDLSHFLFGNLDTGKHQDVRELLEIYYRSFSKHLTSYGCDPDKVYSFDKLLEHWKKFSHFGLFLSCLIIKVCLHSDKISEFKEVADRGGHVFEQFNFSLDENEDNSTYFNRVKNNFLFYSRNTQFE